MIKETSIYYKYRFIHFTSNATNLFDVVSVNAVITSTRAAEQAE